MKKIKIYIIIIIPVLAWLLQGCSQFIYNDQKTNNNLPNPIGQILLDNSNYTLYVRTVTSSEYRVPGQKTGHRILGLQGNDNNQPLAQLSAGASAAPKKVIEIEYLFVSETLGNVIYVSTVADRYQDRYSTPSFLGLDHPNVADFRVFLFGRVDPYSTEKFIFYDPDGKHTDTWTLSTANNGSKTLHLIEQKRFAALEESFLVDDALADSLTFKKQGNFRVMYLAKKDTNIKNALPMLPESIQVGTDSPTRFSLLFPFQDHAISFPSKYVIYSPQKNLQASGNP